MSHLGDLLSALVDGELSGAELDRANAHVAVCGACRVEANALRRLKRELRSFAEGCVAIDATDFTERLLAMTSQEDSQIPVRYLDRKRGPYSAEPPHPAGPPRRRMTRARRIRYLLWSAVSLVILGIGSVAFGLGGGPGGVQPQITPQLEVFDAQHALFSGEVPYADPLDETVTPRISATGVPATAGVP
jgi:anti-sigma factor RsiW